MIEIRAHDLRFTVDEVAAFVHKVMGLDLSLDLHSALFQ
jgi:ATP/maltotriose-dependent transcriptional regulator MalT